MLSAVSSVKTVQAPRSRSASPQRQLDSSGPELAHSALVRRDDRQACTRKGFARYDQHDDGAGTFPRNVPILQPDFLLLFMKADERLARRTRARVSTPTNLPPPVFDLVASTATLHSLQFSPLRSCQDPTSISPTTHVPCKRSLNDSFPLQLFQYGIHFIGIVVTAVQRRSARAGLTTRQPTDIHRRRSFVSRCRRRATSIRPKTRCGLPR